MDRASQELAYAVPPSVLRLYRALSDYSNVSASCAKGSEIYLESRIKVVGSSCT